MKKSLFFLFLLPLAAFSVLDWSTVKLDGRVSIDFPEAPEQKEMSGNPVWVCDAEGGTRCMAMIVDFTKFGMDSAMVAQEMGKPESFSDFKNGVLGQIEGSSLISEKNTTVKGYRCFDYVIDMGKKDTAALNIMHNKNIFVGAKMYSFSYYEKNGKPVDAVKNKFFNSFKVN